MTKNNWRIMADESTNLKISHFYTKKDGMCEPTCELIKKLKDMKIEIKILRMDNAGENKLLQQRCESADWQFAMKDEYTGRYTPQHNHLAELGFATLGNKGRALMVRANIPLNKRYLLFREAFKTLTYLDYLVVTTVGTKKVTRHEHFYGTNPKWMKFLRTWGEAEMVKVKTKTTPYLADRGIHCMFIGYADDHDGDVYRMWKPKTERVHIARDVIWMKQMMFTKGVKEPVIDMTNEDTKDGQGDVKKPTDPGEIEDSGSDEESEDDSSEEETAEDDEPWNDVTTRSGRSVRALLRLIAELGARALGITKAEEHYYALLDQGGEAEFDPEELICIGAALVGGFQNIQELHVKK
jgi:hypothetical protein